MFEWKISTSIPSSAAYLRMCSSYWGRVMGPKTSTCTLPRMFMPAPCITRTFIARSFDRCRDSRYHRGMIEINERIEVPSAAPRVVWDLLSDPKDVVGCVPGATLGEEHEDGSFDGSMTVKFGPARVTFKARIELDLDESTMTGKVTARGKDNQGGTRFRATMGFEVVEQ